MSEKQLPLLGAAMRIDHLPAHREWLIESQRDLEIQDAAVPSVLDGDDWSELVRQAKTALDGYSGRLGIHGPFFGFSLASLDPAVRQLAAQRFKRSLEFGSEIGATHMVVHSPFAFFGHPQVMYSASNTLGMQIECAQQTLKDIVPLAQNLGLVIVIENIQDANTRPLLELVKSFGSEHVRMSLDTGHANLMHQVGGPTADQWVYDAGELLGHLHLQDNDGGLDRHWAPGQGDIKWHALFKALQKQPHQPRMILEVAPDDIRPAADWLAAQGLAR
ncbi:sugar phosphate isomerase/epimerase [Deinobacterium chartae]|uniref:Sugar phosphate isomerase/epimerase n=1 Tax=Deinobacterium chartae TaxID=521158 RepID=A0A841I6U1_9DEIO|nr:sugar phosphate isomerase/epimerase family protein [Deinobacterium chartae]MBB6100130.1 sugar phosphate isomerase/epimerase [Deinobacterium chartae]